MTVFAFVIHLVFLLVVLLAGASILDELGLRRHVRRLRWMGRRRLRRA